MPVATEYLVRAALVLMLLPAIVIPWEGRRVPGWLFALLALAGLGAQLLLHGWQGGGLALVGALGVTGACLVAVTAMRRHEGLQVLTGGHIKLLGAGACWLGPGGALAMLAVAVSVLVAHGLFLHFNALARRPDFSAIAAASIVAVSVVQM